MGINLLKSGGLGEPENLIVDKAILNLIYFLYIICNPPTCFSYEVAYKRISSNMHIDTNETIRTERDEDNIPSEVHQCGTVTYYFECRIKNFLMCDSLGDDRGLGNIKLQSIIFFEDPFWLRSVKTWNTLINLSLT